MSPLIGPVGGRWLNNTIGNVTIVLILLKSKLSVVVDRLPSFFIHKTTILNISSKRTFSYTGIATNKTFYACKLAETINKMSVNCTSLIFSLAEKKGEIINYSFCHIQKTRWLFRFLNSLNSRSDHLFC